MRESGLGLGLDPCPSLAQSPSLNGHSSGAMAKIAARVFSEFAHPNNATYYGHDAFPGQKNQRPIHQDDVRGDLDPRQEGGDSDFEFAVPGVGEYSSPISADEIFHNGQIKPLFPKFSTDLVYANTNWRNDFRQNRSILPQSRSPSLEVERNSKPKVAEQSRVRISLKKLMISERETSLTESVSCSTSEADELEGLAPESYCVWAPNMYGMRKKSQSAGTAGYSKRWKFRDLLYRSNSDGGNAHHFLTSKPKNDQKKDRHTDSVERIIPGDRRRKKKAIGKSDRKISYLVVWFANMNGLSRAVQPF